MATVLPFHGLLPEPDKVEKVAAVPYDVVNTEEAAGLAKDNMLSFLRVSRPEIELEEGIDLHDDKVYAKAAENFKRLCETAPLKLDEREHVYVYSQKMGDHLQIGIVGAASAEDYDNNVIKKHEKTRKDKEDDRTRHLMTIRSHTGPVFLTYKDDTNIDAVVDQITSGAPLFDFTAPDGIKHTLWRASLDDSLKISELFKKIDVLYVADGHHRSAAASRSAAQCKSENPGHTGKEDYNFFLSVIFPSSQLKILPYNRSVHDLNGLSKDEFMAKVQEKFSIEDTANPVPQKHGEICMHIDGKWHLMKPKFDIGSLGVIERLDVSILQDNVLAPILGIDDPRTSKRIDFVGGIRGTGELEKLVNSGKGAVAFSMFPTTVDQLMDIADADEIMPPKSTWFEPKLRDGLVSHNF
jgi:uncharacterized protein (DUF1015 family)